MNETYMVDAYRLLDLMNKGTLKDLTDIEIWVRNHMYAAIYKIPHKDFEERPQLHFHTQIPASQQPIIKEEENGN